MTVARRLLIHVAFGVAFVVAVVTAVTYWLVFDALKRSGLRQLDTYVRERAEREEARFLQVQTNMTLVRAQFLARLDAPMREGRRGSSRAEIPPPRRTSRGVRSIRGFRCAQGRSNGRLALRQAPR